METKTGDRKGKTWDGILKKQRNCGNAQGEKQNKPFFA